MSNKLIALLSAAGLGAATLAVGATGSGAAVPVDSQALQDAVTVDGIMEHLEELQTIADANGGNREASSTGYDASVAYVVERLTAAGYEPVVEEFEYPYFADASAPTLARVAPSPISYVDAGVDGIGDFATMSFSASGSGTNVPVTPVDLALDDPPSSTSGCEPEDFAEFTAGTVALVQRGACDFAVKVANADAAGAAAVIVFNQGDDPDDPERTDVFFGTLGGVVADIPSFSASFSVGGDLAVDGATVSFSADTINQIRESANVLADTAAGRDDRVVVVGAHLDSVEEGAGINDNGSGTAAILEIAEALAELEVAPTNTVRFAFWGAEEAGLVGATEYVAGLTKAEAKDIALNLNFDMVGSPNYVPFVYDGDGSATGTAGPNGSGNIERVFLDHFATQGVTAVATAFDGRSDYGPFIDVGIPAGGLFTGAEGIKTTEEADLYGGMAGVAYDPCYHAACDDITNLSPEALDLMSDAAAHAVLTFAMTTSSVSGTARGSSNATPMDHAGPNALR